MPRRPIVPSVMRRPFEVGVYPDAFMPRAHQLSGQLTDGAPARVACPRAGAARPCVTS